MLCIVAAFVCGLEVFASDVKLIVQQIDNQGAVAGNTYRVYAQLPSADYSLQVVYGDATNPLSIRSDAAFFQCPVAGFSAAGASQALEQVDPTVRYDSWITVGYSDNQNNSMWDIGVNFSEFDQGGEIKTSNGGWFLVPTDEKCTPNSQGLVLIGQFTSTGIIKGLMNLQGKTPTGEVWKATGVGFITTQSCIFGCTDRSSANFNPQATFDDGSCQEQGQCLPKPSATVFNGDWEIFPNPLRDNLLNIQFGTLEVKPGARIDIMDMNGKTIATHTVGKDAPLSGNRITIEQSLAAGTYQVVLLQNNQKETKTLIVQ